MPNGIDPKAYAARLTQAKKTVANISPATKAKLEEYYPKVTKEDIAKQMLSPKTTLSDMEKRIKTQPDHHVTDSNNHTKPITPAMPAKRPAVGTDKAAQKKYGDSSWNNGYTN